MLKYFYWILAALLVGCAYQQPDISEPYALIQPLGGIRILKINDERVVSLSGAYIMRVSPGNHTLLLGRGHNESTPVEGTQSPYARFDLEAKEGMCYYIEPSLKFGLNTLFFGAGFKEVKSWKPVLKKEEPIRDYRKKGEGKILEN